MLRQDIDSNIPEAFLLRMQDVLKGEYPAFLESLNGDEQKALRVNPLSGFKGFDEDLAKEWKLEEVSWEKCGFYYDAKDSKVPPGKHPLHEAGAYYIQEASAMYPVSLLAPKKGERILDLCAAPGGKSTQIASYMENTGLLISNEIIPSRAAVLSSNIERMGVKNTVVTNMEPQEISAFFPALFDRVLVDAPCSGEGMLRRGEAARQNWSEENVLMCAKRQRDILDEASKCVRPGGYLLYSTCTFSKEEDEENADEFLSRHGDYELEKLEKLYPHKIRGEGHFAALFRRKGGDGFAADPENPGEKSRSKGSKKRKDGTGADVNTALEALKDFLSDEAFNEIEKDRIISFKDSLYLLPEGMISLDGIRVLRPGLCLGSVKKGRFEPSHSLASSLRSGEAKRCFDIASGSREAYDYLFGMSLVPDGKRADDLPDGWCVVSFDGVSAGLGKKTGNTIKNHYPKGLRIKL